MTGPPPSKTPPEPASSEGAKAEVPGGVSSAKVTTTPVDVRKRERFRLHTSVRGILRRDAARRKPGVFPGDIHRTIDCTWARCGDVSLVKPVGRDSYHYKGVVTCGVLWSCPICASKIQERRRGEVALAVVWAETRGKQACMVSYTFPHRGGDALSDLLHAQQKALAWMRGTRAYKSIMQSLGFDGRIRAQEVTHGDNGWHPHTHELLFLDCLPGPSTRDALASLWLKACRKFGLFVDGRDQESNFMRYAVDVTASSEASAKYLTKLDDQNKWTLAHEVTKSSSKQGRRNGRHPFQLAGDKSTEHLFTEYVWAMKGQRQLIWSRGLKDAVGINDQTDEEIAAVETEVADDQIGIGVRAWHYVRSNDARFELLRAAELGGRAGVDRFFELLGVDNESEESEPQQNTVVALGASCGGASRSEQSTAMDPLQERPARTGALRCSRLRSHARRW